MPKYSLYKVYCIEEDTFYETHGWEEPTQCPNPASHDRTIDTNQTTVIHSEEFLSKAHETITPKIDRATGQFYVDLQTKFLYCTSIMTEIRAIKLVGRMISGSNYSIKVYNNTTNETLAEKTFSNTESEIIDMGLITNRPPCDSILEFHVKGDSASSEIEIENIVIYYL